MTPVLATEAYAFALGCALIHAARNHADVVTRLLTVVAIIAALVVLLGASLGSAPDDDMAFDLITIFSAG